MGKAERYRQERARERIVAQQVAARRAEARRRMLIVVGSAVAVIAVVVALVLFKSLGGHKSAPTAQSNGRTVNATLARQVTNVPVSVLNAVGAGPTSGTSAVVPLTTISSPPLTANGKPQVLYVGAEYCPYCAAERWAMVVALSRFGTFSGLRFIHSTPNDAYSNTSTLTFYKSTYVSNYLTFTPVEWFDVANKTLETPSNDQKALLNKYGKGSFPFVDVGGKYIISGAQYLPSVLGTLSQQDPAHFGLTWAQIAADMQNANNPVGQAIIGSANHITAAICKITNEQPASVCKSSAVTAVGANI